MPSCLCADLLLLKDEEDLKCFTRTQHDFTCFFETSDNRTYDLLYRVGGYVRRGCILCSAHEAPGKGAGLLNLCFWRVTSQDQKV